MMVATGGMEETGRVVEVVGEDVDAEVGEGIVEVAIKTVIIPRAIEVMTDIGEMMVEGEIAVQGQEVTLIKLISFLILSY